MFAFLEQLFKTTDFPARWYCGRWSNAHGWLHILSDTAIFGAYAAIPCTLIYFIRKRRDIPFPPIFWLFAAFIFACGFGHLVDATIFWHPWYRFAGMVKLLTASVSWLTVIALVKITPKALALPGLAKVNEQLGKQIAERREVELALRSSEERHRALVAAAQSIMWSVDPSGAFVAPQPSWEAFTGQTWEQHRGLGWLDAIHPEDRDTLLRQWNRAAQTLTTYQSSSRLRFRDGTFRHIITRAAPLADDSGVVREWIGICIDITQQRRAERALVTERKRAEREKEDLTGQLRALNADLEERVRSRTSELTGLLKEREVLLQEVHHRVKNNLQVISSLINMQMRKLEDGTDRGALEGCQTRVQAIALIHEKLYQSKDYSRVPFSEYACGLVNSVFQATGASPSMVSLDLAIEDLALAVNKAIPCGLVLNELITNSLKHGFKAGRAGTIRVELAALDDGRLRLAVKDTGVGLPEGFDIHKSESVGLQIVCTLSEQLGAELEVSGQGGASIQLTFPLEPEATITKNELRPMTSPGTRLGAATKP